MHVNEDAVEVVLEGIRCDPTLAMGAAHEIIRRGVLYPPQFDFDQGAFCRRLVNRCPEMEPLLFHLRFIGVVYDVMAIGFQCEVFTGWEIRRHEEEMLTVLKQLYGDDAKLLLMMLAGTVS